MIRVLGIDVASSAWAANGSALLGFQSDADHFVDLKVPALAWPDKALTAEALADVIDGFVRQAGVAAVALDGPQGWRDPETPQGTPGVGRRCEYESRTQAKTGVYPQTYPANQRRWVEFSIELFELLLKRPGVRLASIDACGAVPGDGYVVLECFPTSGWRTAGLPPLPGKSQSPELSSFAERLFAGFRIVPPPVGITSHDDLQAVVAALAAAAYVGGPAVPLHRGVPAVPRGVDGRLVLTEGLIWDAKPPDSALSLRRSEASGSRAEISLSLPIGLAVRVTQNVLDQVVRAGRSQAQVALQGFPQGTKRERLAVMVRVGDVAYPLVIGDSHAAWAVHQTDEASAGFDRLFAWLSDQPNTWMPVSVEAREPPVHVGPDHGLASHGPPVVDELSRTVSIPVRVVKGKLEGFDRALPALKDCVGDLVVPAFAVTNPADLEWLTRSQARMLFDVETLLLCRVSGRQVPVELLKKCRTVAVPDSLSPGVFVELILTEPLFLRSRGTKTATLDQVRCIVPALDDLRAESLNEAYRLISQVFEPKRRSAGGNVFRSCYYFDAERDQWRPIGELRGDLIFVPR